MYYIKNCMKALILAFAIINTLMYLGTCFYTANLNILILTPSERLIVSFIFVLTNLAFRIIRNIFS